VSGVTAAALAQNGILAPASAAAVLETGAATSTATVVATPAAPAQPVATDAESPARTSTTNAPAVPFVPAPHRHATTTQVGTPPAFGKAPSPAGAVGGTVFALVFVVGLILALAWLAKRMPGVAGSSNRALRVVASLSLGPREKIVVVDVGGKQLLLGVGAGGTRTLHTLEAPLPEAERSATPPFAQLLAQHFGKKA